MKIINSTRINNLAKAKPYPRRLICDYCDSELEYDESDLYMKEYGCMYVDCPVCGHSNMLVENEHSIILTKDNVVFPLHFHHISKDDGAVDNCNEETVRKYIDEFIRYLRNHHDEYFCGGYVNGNTYVIVERFDGDNDYEVTVSNDFYQTYIPFDNEDYLTYNRELQDDCCERCKDQDI